MGHGWIARSFTVGGRELAGTGMAALVLLWCLGVGCGGVAPETYEPVYLIDQIPSLPGRFERADLPQLHQRGAVAASITVNAETQRAMAVALPSRMTLAARLPSQPVLTFSTAVATLGGPGNGFPVSFEVTIQAGAGDEVTFETRVRRSQRNLWLHRRVDLSSWAGKDVRLTFAVRSQSPGGNADLFPLWGNPVLSDAASPPDRTPVFLISIDCLRADHVGAYGYPRDTTPHLDAFAREATLFESATATSSWTLVTHMTMLTGWMPSFHGASRTEALAESIPYLPELLAGNGYQSDAIVSGAYLSPEFGCARGFHSYQFLTHPRARDTVDASLKILDRSGRVNHFVFVHIIDPHWRYLAPEPYLDRFGPVPEHVYSLLDKVPRQIPPSVPEEIQSLVNLYDGEVAYADEQLGRFLEELKSRGLYDRALILITADHGEAFYEHGLWQHTSALYEEMIRIPLIVKWPGQRSGNRVLDPVSQIDVFPTLMEVTGASMPAVYGRSLSRFRHRSGSGETGPIISETTWPSAENSYMMVSIRQGYLKYIATFTTEPDDPLRIERLQREELFDLEADPDEKEDLMDPASALKFRRELERYLQKAREFRSARERGESVVPDPSLVEHLRTLGYIQ